MAEDIIKPSNIFIMSEIEQTEIEIEKTTKYVNMKNKEQIKHLLEEISKSQVDVDDVKKCTSLSFWATLLRTQGEDWKIGYWGVQTSLTTWVAKKPTRHVNISFKFNNETDRLEPSGFSQETYKKLLNPLSMSLSATLKDLFFNHHNPLDESQMLALKSSTSNFKFIALKDVDLFKK